ncbi:MAG: hypothetical protein NWQ28_11345 [Nodularia sp. (in: cyanobacteria)]|nr:hypothetical protein [Nodularia sp. (in: cyanobacteria)]
MIILKHSYLELKRSQRRTAPNNFYWKSKKKANIGSPQHNMVLIKT